MRIALFDAFGSYFSVPSLRCMLEEFDRNDCTVDVYLRLGGEQLSGVCKAKAQPFPVPFHIWGGDLENTLRQWKWYLRYCGYKGRRVLDRYRYDLTIGLNPEGVVAAHRYWRRTGTPFIYLSFEMLFRDELRKISLIRLKNEEIAASQDAAFVISSDKWRAELLSEENGLPLEKIAFLPVAPRASFIPYRNEYLRELYHIRNDQTVVLHSGAFGAFTRADELMRSLSRWPADFVLVIHTHYRVGMRNPYLEQLRRLRFENVRITDGALPPTEYEIMLTSADIGLATYRFIERGHPFEGKNVATMGLSSGKLAQYARACIPVVAMGNLHIKELMEQYHFGFYANTVDEIPKLLQRVRDNREYFAQGAREFFLEKLDFGRFWPPIWEKLCSLSASPWNCTNN